MKTMLYRVFVFLLLLLPIRAMSQALVVEDYYATTGFGAGQYLNVAIASDTSSAAFKAGTRVYVLHKNGIYAWNASLDFQAGSTVTMRAAYGETGHYDPTIYFYPTATGGGAPPGQMTQLSSNMTLRMTHLMISGYNEQVDSLLKLANTAGLRTLSTSSNTRIYMDSCIWKSIAGQIIRTEGPAAVIKVTNSIFADMGHPTSNFGAGKFIDARNVRIDTMFIQNCTFVNLYDRVIRHYQATSANSIRNLIFDHNTVLYDMAYHGFISLGTAWRWRWPRRRPRKRPQRSTTRPTVSWTRRPMWPTGRRSTRRRRSRTAWDPCTTPRRAANVTRTRPPAAAARLPSCASATATPRATS